MENYKQYMELLESEYLDTAIWMENRMDSSNIVGETKEAAMDDILDMLLCAQKSGRSVEQTIGRNRTRFFQQYKKSIIPLQDVQSMIICVIEFLVMVMIMDVVYVIMYRITGDKLALQQFNQLPALCMGMFLITIGRYSENWIRMKYYHLSEKEKKHKKRIKFLLQIAAMVLLVSFFEILNLRWIVSFGKSMKMLLLLAGMSFLLLALMQMHKEIPDHLDDRLIANILRDYQKKKRRKGWDEQRYIEYKKRDIYYFFPVSVAVIFAEMIGLFGILIWQGTVSRLAIIVVVMVSFMLLYVIIVSGIEARRMMRYLLTGKVRLDVEEDTKLGKC